MKTVRKKDYAGEEKSKSKRVISWGNHERGEKGKIGGEKEI